MFTCYAAVSDWWCWLFFLFVLFSALSGRQVNYRCSRSMALSSLATPAVINTSDYKSIIVYVVPLGIRPVVTAPVSVLYISLSAWPLRLAYGKY